jgi:hypothetical protein
VGNIDLVPILKDLVRSSVIVVSTEIEGVAKRHAGKSLEMD